MKTKNLLSIIIIILLTGFAFSSIISISGVSASSASESTRDQLAEQILSTTVRIQVESWIVLPDEKGYGIDTSMGHGTVMAGRYLVTHNHFSVPLSILQQQESAGSYGVVYIYNDRGELLHKGPLTDYEVAQRDAETLVFAHKEAGFFEKLGFASAVAAYAALALEPGMLVAQVDWDGTTARVDWVSVKEIILEDGAPRMVLADGVLPGASGGGIFWNGQHVANNWQLHEKIDATGTVVEAVTAVALNSAEVSDLQ